MSNLSEFKTRLNSAFAAMRKQGLMARQNFKCCLTCAGYDIATSLKAFPKRKLEAFQGCVFYTKQDGEGMTSRYRQRFSGLYLAFGPVDVDSVEHGKPTVEVGRIVKRCLIDVGLEVEWDGTAEKRIFVRVPGEAV